LMLQNSSSDKKCPNDSRNSWTLSLQIT
jgi:hypothetical protein